MSNIRMVWTLSLVLLAGCPTGQTRQSLFGGQATALRPEIGLLSGGCTGTVVDPQIVLTAAHCLDYKNSVPQGSVFLYESSGVRFAISLSQGYSVGSQLGDTDIAVVRLANAFPTTVAQPATITREAPQNGRTLTVFGYGCNAPDGSGSGYKRWVVFTAGSSTGAGCEGDSGGPVVVGRPEEGGSVWAVVSGRGSEDIYAIASHAIPVVNAVRRVGGTTFVNERNGAFAIWAQEPGAKLLSGDFNRDGLDDLALTGVPGWGTIPVALRNERGGFRILNPRVAAFPGWAAEPGVQALSGDFDGDGWGDIALVGRPGWTTVPVAYSGPGGGFDVRNIEIPQFAAFASTPGVTAVSGDFDGDRKSDIALVGGRQWTSVPIAFSGNRGHLAMRNIQVPEFAELSKEPGAKAVAGRFDDDHRWDLALIGGSAWKSIPLAISQQGYTFRFTNEDVDDFPQWAGRECAPGVVVLCLSPKVVAGDFDGDGIDDILLAGRPGWRTLAFAFSRRRERFEPGNLPLDSVPGWAAEPGAQIVAGRFNRDVQVDLAVAGGQGWRTIPTVTMRR